LLLLPGVGPQLAQRIDKHRREHGPFQAVSDLRKVSGIGPALFERISPKVMVGPPVAMDPAERGEESLVEPPANATKRSKVESLEGPIDINQADIHELQRLPGIGPKLSQRIVDERGRRAFQSVQDLRRVPGIGAKTLAKIKPFVKV
jgi:competence protein ComEA